MSIVGKLGYKKTGHFAGLTGEIAPCDLAGFEDKYRIVFDNGASVVCSPDDIEIVHEVILSDWEYESSCECGVELIIDGEIITKYYEGDVKQLKQILNHFGIAHKIRFETEYR